MTKLRVQCKFSTEFNASCLSRHMPACHSRDYVERSSRWNWCWQATAAPRRRAAGAGVSPTRFPPKHRRLWREGSRLVGRWRRTRKAAGFPANNAKWCICQGEFVHRRRRAPRAASDIRHSIRSPRTDRRSRRRAPPPPFITIRSTLQVNNGFVYLF